MTGWLILLFKKPLRVVYCDSASRTEYNVNLTSSTHSTIELLTARRRDTGTRIETTRTILALVSNALCPLEILPPNNEPITIPRSVEVPPYTNWEAAPGESIPIELYGEDNTNPTGWTLAAYLWLEPQKINLAYTIPSSGITIVSTGTVFAFTFTFTGTETSLLGFGDFPGALWRIDPGFEGVLATWTLSLVKPV